MKQITLQDLRAVGSAFSRNERYFLANSYSSPFKLEPNVVSRYRYIARLAQRTPNPVLTIGCPELPGTIPFRTYTHLYPQLLGVYHNLDRSRAKQEPQQVGAICISDLAEDWDQQAQVICDLLTTRDGRIGEVLKSDPEHIPVYCFAQSEPYRVMLEATHQFVFGQKLCNFTMVDDIQILQDFKRTEGADQLRIQQAEGLWQIV